MTLVIYCADIGSVPNNRFGWARGEDTAEGIEPHRGGAEIVELVDEIADDLNQSHRVALGFECPLFIPVPSHPLQLGRARPGEGNRSWSAGAGSGALATGLAEAAWILSELRSRCPTAVVHLDWAEFGDAGGLFLWEAFVSSKAKGTTHVGDAAIAVEAFREALPDPRTANALGGERPFSLLGAALVWSGWESNVELLHEACVVIKAAPPAAANAATQVKNKAPRI